ncbi:hypothetical protein D3Y59_04695 [Hymenobacter oligotrophus]|uniref:Uncharacterized protein n=1 Tax=Hymenobacter oligotrophus TaxID=2319843 RepID=A0A3B7QXX8_9BACT|nr:hypothetical protein [Hymenobacter oligotrophus]AYA36415.1 hypothetical protein D3Y59_04695 [Hymenobacter oligotrophus]
MIGAVGLMLAACAGPPVQRGLGADGLELQLRAQTESAYNIVWLRATLRNRGPRPVRLRQLPDTLESACTPALGLVVRGLTPNTDTAAICQRCPPAQAPRSYVVLRPGQQMSTAVQVDFNRVLPRAVLDTLRQCLRYNNRTLGAYRFWVQYQPAPTGPPAAASNLVRVYRQQ